ncbi:hypothetical protein ADL02_46210 [Streptomyces sp. NRRL WC-3723]|nr:hypothetical protein ADL02_46210 [Streptomyces sp. NRRL WC-3723]
MSTIGASLVDFSMLPFLCNVSNTSRHVPHETLDDPWNFGHALQCSTVCALPGTTSWCPEPDTAAFDLHHPEYRAAELRGLHPAQGPASMQGS